MSCSVISLPRKGDFFYHVSLDGNEKSIGHLYWNNMFVLSMDGPYERINVAFALHFCDDIKTVYVTNTAGEHRFTYFLNLHRGYIDQDSIIKDWKKRMDDKCVMGTFDTPLDAFGMMQYMMRIKMPGWTVKLFEDNDTDSVIQSFIKTNAEMLYDCVDAWNPAMIDDVKDEIFKKLFQSELDEMFETFENTPFDFDMPKLNAVVSDMREIMV